MSTKAQPTTYETAVQREMLAFAEEIARLRAALRSIALCTDEPAIRLMAKEALGDKP